jgi:hypothetical protein
MLPAKKPPKVKTPYRTLLAVSVNCVSIVPLSSVSVMSSSYQLALFTTVNTYPAPRFETALNIPTEQKVTKPTITTWVHGELSRYSCLVLRAHAASGDEGQARTSQLAHSSRGQINHFSCFISPPEASRTPWIACGLKQKADFHRDFKAHGAINCQRQRSR